MTQKKIGKSVFTRSLSLLIIMVMFVTVFSTKLVIADNSATDKYGINGLTDITNELSEYYLNQSVLNNSDALDAISKDQKVNVIVELTGESVLDRYLQRAITQNFNQYANTSLMRDYANELEIKQNDLYKKIASSISLQKKYNYTTLLNGFSAEIKYGDIKALEKQSGVKNVIISEKYELAQTQSAVENDVNVYSTGIYDSSNVDYNGEGTIVAILDTGLDYYHTAFQNQPVGKVSKTKDDIANIVTSLESYSLSISKDTNPFVLTTDQVYISSKVPYAYDYADKDADVYPVNDHGTHVAGIIAGKDAEITGVATNAQLAIMKVFSNEDNGADTTDILAALADCILLNVDVINMSLGASCGFARERDDDRTNELYDKIKTIGISLIVAASNDYSAAQGSAHGDTNYTSNPDSGTVGSPSSYAAAMSVASISGVKTKYLLGNNKTTVYFTESAKTTGDKNDFVADLLGSKDSGLYEYVTIPGIGLSSDYSGLDVRGKIALVKRGNITFEEKVLTAQAKGAIAVVIYNNISGNISMSVGNNCQIPACSISMDIGNILAQQEEGTMEVSNSYMAGPFMSDFSSWGVLPDLELKPDITAHGGEIYSAVRGGYDRISGTSMAAPNMAGATLLVREYVKEYFPHLVGAQITELAYQLMMSTATIAYNQEGNPYSPRKQGAGLADISNTVNTKAYLWVEGENKTKLSLGDDPNKSGYYELEFKITNISNTAQSYAVVPSIMTETVSSDGKTVAEKAHMFNNSAVNVSVSGNGALSGDNTVIVPGYKTATIKVTIQLTNEEKKYIDDNFVNGMYVEGFVQLLNYDQDGVDLSIPWLAFYGDWTAAPMFDYTQYEIDESAADPSVLERDKLSTSSYATVPMAGFRVQIGTDQYDEYTWGLGVYGYKLAEGYEQPFSDEDKAAISESIDGSYTLKGVYAGLLRGAKQVGVIICNAVTGEIVYEDIYENARKSYYNGGRRPGYIEMDLNAAEYGLENNTKYVMTLVGSLDWEGEQNNLRNQIQFSFYVDSEAPVLNDELTSVRIEEDSEGVKTYYLDMYIFDNHYIQCYSISTFKSYSNGTFVDRKSLVKNTIPVIGGRGVTNKVTFNLTEYWDEIGKEYDENICIEVIDYAKNSRIYTFKLPRVYAEEISFTEGKDQYTININETIDIKKNLILTPSDTWKEKLIWKSNDESIARVYDGQIMGVSAGTTTIEVSSPTGAKASVSVTVRDRELPPITLKKLILNKTSLKMEQGEEFELTVELDPWNIQVEDVEVNWRSTNNKIITVTVDPNNPYKAVVKGIYEGSAMIVVSSGSYITAVCNVTIESMFEVEGRVLKSYKGRGDENGLVVIPDDLGIVYIYEYAFFGNPYITKIIIPEGVTEIGHASIYGCDNLQEVVLPSSLEKIETFGLAWNPNLVKVNLDNVRNIGDRAFVNCYKLNNINLRNVHSIGYAAFYQATGLTTADLTNAGFVDEMAFAYCSALTTVITSVNTGIGNLAFYKCTSLVDLTLYTTQIGNSAFRECTGLKNVTFVSDISEIGDTAFYKCTKLENITFIGEVRSIGLASFAGCTALVNLNLPNGLEYLGETAFADCTKLKTVIIPADAKITNLGRAVFGNCSSLQSYIVEDGNKYLTSNNGILYDKGCVELLSVPYGKTFVGPYTILDSVLRIGDYAFSYISSITEVNLNNVEYIGEGAFYYCSALGVINYGDNLKEIGDHAFYRCYNLRQVKLPEGLQVLGASAFYDCYYISGSTTYELVIPSSLQVIGFNAFRNVRGIGTVTVSEGVEIIGGQAFAECPNLVTVNLPESLRTIEKFAFYNCPKLKNITIPNQVEELGSSIFAGCTSLTSIQLPTSVSTIPNEMYYGCTALVNITIPEHIKEIGNATFYGCTKLISVNFNNTEKIGSSAFYGTKLVTINGNKVTEVGSSAFARVITLTSINLPEVQVIGEGAFHNCTGLDRNGVSIGNVVIIGKNAFYNCASLEEIVIDNATHIGVDAFRGSGLKQVSIAKVQEIGAGAFIATNLANLTLPATLEVLGERAFSYIGTLTDIAVDSDNNSFFVTDNVLYKVLPNGKYELVTYPTTKNDPVYTVLEGTVRIAPDAFAANKKLTKVILPSSLEAIGALAFFDTNIKTYQFLSLEAPILESIYDSSKGQSYCNFVDYIENAAVLDLKLIYPSNGQGYTSYVWNKYFTSVEKGENALSKTTLNLISGINNLPEDITLADYQMVVSLRQTVNQLNSSMYNQIDQEVLIKLANAEAIVSQLLNESGLVIPDNSHSEGNIVVTSPIDTNNDLLGLNSNEGNISIVILSVIIGLTILVACIILIPNSKKFITRGEQNNEN